MDFFSAFINWFSESGKDLPAIQNEEGGKDLFSRFMISD